MELKDRITKILASLDSQMLETVEKSKNESLQNNLRNNMIPMKKRAEFNLYSRIERSFVTRFGKSMEKIIACVIESSGGDVLGIDKSAEPYDIKFIRSGDKTSYFAEVKSILGQNKSNQKEIDNNRKKAASDNAVFSYFVYNEDINSNVNKTNEGVYINDQIWHFVTNSNQKIVDEVKDCLSSFNFTFLDN